MCSTAAALIGTQVVSGLLNYKSQQSKYDAQIDLYNAQAQAANQNALITERQNTRLAEQYANEQNKLNAKRKLMLAQNNAAAGASGLVGGVGSVADVGEGIDAGFKQDSQDLLAKQRDDTWANYVRQVNYANQARSYLNAADNIKKQKKNSLLSTLIGTAASVYGSVNSMGGALGSGGSSYSWNGISSDSTDWGLHNSSRSLFG